ncbi:hypothetical protein [Hymenobacter sublimis]|uniref:Uncharacterized protein n=1 Tax=Hymenobacter sublimis TaxID=2933777 RepID=A0ABY4J7A4_9BACT|nr:hypothetical protein [Hymenobacter sublimis]UPL48673.1 hypothetical protein MWH26_15960 [Hymenobacter sublimis]
MSLSSLGLAAGQTRATPASPLQLIQELPQLQLSHNAAHNWLYADWRGRQTAATVLEGAELIVATVAAGKYNKLLNDNTRLTIMDVTAAEWRSMHVLPRLFACGLQYLAWVYSPDPQGRLHTDYSVDHSSWPLVLTFEECSMAAEWLRQY